MFFTCTRPNPGLKGCLCFRKRQYILGLLRCSSRRAQAVGRIGDVLLPTVPDKDTFALPPGGVRFSCSIKISVDYGYHRGALKPVLDVPVALNIGHDMVQSTRQRQLWQSKINPSFALQYQS